MTSLSQFSAPTILKPSKPFAAAFAALALALAGCASGLGANSYERASVGTVARVEEGTVVASRSVVIEGSRTGATVGTAAGAAIGGIAGSQVGGGREENAIGAVVGAVAGGALGHAIGNSANRQPGFAYTVRLRSGELISIAQGGDLPIANGTPVLVEYGERARVIPQNISIGY
jgi:outer membrane lipoprotein SlyB